MHELLLAHGCASDMSEAVKCIPESTRTFAVRVSSVCIASIRFLDELGRVTSGSSLSEEPQAFGPFGPLPPLTRGAVVIEATQHGPCRISVFPLQPTPDALPYPEVETMELPICTCGILVVVPPSQQDRIKLVDDIGECAPGRDSSHHDLDLVAQVVQLALRDEEIADSAASLARLGLRHPVAKEVKAFFSTGDLSLFDRQFHAQFRLEELRQRELFRFRLLPRAIHEDDEVVRVAHHVKRRSEPPRVCWRPST